MVLCLKMQMVIEMVLELEMQMVDPGKQMASMMILWLVIEMVLELEMQMVDPKLLSSQGLGKDVL
jgi:hypothetical protein